MSEAAIALVKLIDSGALTLNAPMDNTAILAMQDASALALLIGDGAPQIWCPFYPWAKSLSQNFTKTLSETLPLNQKADCIIVLPSKQKDEAAYMIAAALSSLNEGGEMIVGAANDAGGNRLKNIIESFGGDVLDTHAKNKCKIITVQCTADALKQDAIHAALAQAAPQPILDGAFTSQIGLYGWDKVDIGSALLAQVMDNDLHGLGADFGCGYGFLTRAILNANPKIRALYAIDAEKRAVDLLRQNVVGHDSVLHPVWDDLSAPDRLPKNLDFVVMNPPFHSGKSTESSLGRQFIATAHMSLKRYGRLFMVANTHLPYERTLDELFHKHHIMAQAHGYKVLYAEK